MSNEKCVDEAVGLWCNVTLVTDAKLEGLIYAYIPNKSLLVLMQNLATQPSAKVINTSFIKSCELKETTTEKLPDQLNTFATLPSMRVGGKGLLKSASTALKEAETNRLQCLKPFDSATATIGLFEVYVPLARVYPGISWVPQSNQIKVSSTVFVSAEPTWATPVAKVKKDTKTQFGDTALCEKIQKALEKIKVR